VNITINLDHEELQKALDNGALMALVKKCSYGGSTTIEPISAAKTQTETEPQQAPAPKEAPAPTPDKQEAESTPQPVPTTARSYTHDEIANAAIALMDKGRQPELLALLDDFGVKAVPQLPEDKLGAFALRLREMGAQI
jgi:hypothetical protein